MPTILPALPFVRSAGAAISFLIGNTNREAANCLAIMELRLFGQMCFRRNGTPGAALIQ